MRKLLKINSILLALILVTTLFPSTVDAIADTTGPTLKRVWFEKDSYTYGETIKVYLEITDDMSGVDEEQIYVIVNSLTGNNSMCQFRGKLVSPNVYLVTFDDVNEKSGNYKVDTVDLFDAVGNRSSYVNVPLSWESQLPNTASIYFSNPGYVEDKTPELHSLSTSIIRRSNKDYSKYDAYPGDSLLIKATAVDTEIILVTYLCNKFKDHGFYRAIGEGLYPTPGQENTFQVELKLTDKMMTSDYEFSSVSLHNGSNIVTPAVKPSWKFKFNYYNSRHLKEPALPTITKVDLNKKTFKPGEEISVKMVVKDTDGYADYNVNDSGPWITTTAHLEGSNNVNSGGRGVTVYLKYKKPITANGKTTGYLFEGKAKVPATAQEGKYNFIYGPNSTSFSYNSLGVHINYSCPESTSTFYVNSIFSGINNETILVGEKFDPLNGVSAVLSDGTDVTNKMEVEGNVDTNTAGVYLVKYKYTGWNAEENKNDYYMSFRWVGVSEILPDKDYPHEKPLALTDEKLKVGAKSTDISISKEGKNVAFKSTLTAPGEYKLNAGRKVAAATVDKEGPITSHELIGKSTVRINVKDPSGIRTIKYLSGVKKKNAFKTAGKTIRNGEKVTAKDGKYTVYAVDKFGNESVKVIKVSRKVKSIKTLAKIYIAKGKTIKLPPSCISPVYASNTSVKWKSKSPGTVRIKNGKIKGIKTGSTTLTVTAQNGKKSAKCKVYVVPKTIKLKKLSLKQKTVTISVGKTLQLKPVLSPEKATGIIPTYKLSNSKIARIDKLGKVTALKKGTATITVTAKGKSVKCKLTIK